MAVEDILTPEQYEAQQAMVKGEEPDPQGDPTANPPVPSFDVEAERTRIREEERQSLQAEFSARTPQNAPQAPQAAVPAVPDRYEDPDAYDAWRDEQTEARIMAKVAPLLGVVNENTIEQRFRSAGVGDAGVALIKKIPGLNATQLDGPGLEILTNAAKYADIQARGPEALAPVRGYSPNANQGNTLSPGELRMIQGTGISEADFKKMKQERGITGDASREEFL